MCQMIVPLPSVSQYTPNLRCLPSAQLDRSVQYRWKAEKQGGQASTSKAAPATHSFRYCDLTSKAAMAATTASKATPLFPNASAPLWHASFISVAHSLIAEDLLAVPRIGSGPQVKW